MPNTPERRSKVNRWTRSRKIFASVPTSLRILTCCGRCELTNRSMAVADAELPPPMAPVVYGGPSFESILATSRDFRFSSFKKADVDMCQASFPPSFRHQPFHNMDQRYPTTRDLTHFFLLSFFSRRWTLSFSRVRFTRSILTKLATRWQVPSHSTSISTFFKKN